MYPGVRAVIGVHSASSRRPSRTLLGEGQGHFQGGTLTGLISGSWHNMFSSINTPSWRLHGSQDVYRRIFVDVLDNVSGAQLLLGIQKKRRTTEQTGETWGGHVSQDSHLRDSSATGSRRKKRGRSVSTSNVGGMTSSGLWDDMTKYWLTYFPIIITIFLWDNYPSRIIYSGRIIDKFACKESRHSFIFPFPYTNKSLIPNHRVRMIGCTMDGWAWKVGGCVTACCSTSVIICYWQVWALQGFGL